MEKGPRGTESAQTGNRPVAQEALYRTGIPFSLLSSLTGGTPSSARGRLLPWTENSAGGRFLPD
jgi:hypothetical protein